MNKTVSDCIPSLKKAADSGNFHELSDALVNSITIFSNSIREFSKNHTFDTSQEKAILSFLNALIYSFQSKTAKTEEFKANYVNLSGLIRQPFILICSQNFTLQFPQKLWKVVSCLISELFYFDESEEWIYHIFLLFELKSPLEKQASKEAAALGKLEYLYSIIEDKYKNTANQWLYCLTQVIYTQFSDYYIIDPPKYCILPTIERFPSQGIIDLNINLIEKKWFIENFSLTTKNVSTFSFFVHILAKLSEGFSKKYLHTSNTIAKIWIEYNPEVKESIASLFQETSFLDDIFIIVNRYIITIVIKQLGFDPNIGVPSGTAPILKKEVWKSFKNLRNEWLILYKKTIDPKTFKLILDDYITKFKPMIVSIGLQFAYDLKSHDIISIFWSYIQDFLNVNKDLMYIPLHVFVSILAANFTPIFQNFSKEEADHFSQKLKERKQRGSSIPESYIENTDDLFNKPLSFLKFNLGLKAKYDELKCKYPVRLFNPVLNGWNHDTALFFVLSVIYNIEGSISSFLIMYFSIQGGIPIFLQRNPGFAVFEFVQSAINQIEKQVDFQLLGSITREISALGFEAKKFVPIIAQKKWLTIISRLICSNIPLYIEQGIVTALETLQALSPISLVLAFESLSVLNQNPEFVTFGEIESFFLSAYNICSFSKFPLEFKLKEQLQQWMPELDENVVINSTALIESSDFHFPKKTIICHLIELYKYSSFNTLLCISVCEARKPHSQQKDMISGFIADSLSSEQPHIKARMFGLMDGLFPMLSKSYPDFESAFIDSLIRNIECSDNIDDRYILSIVLARLVSRGCISWDEGVASCLSHPTLINCLPFTRVPRPSFVTGIEAPDLIMTIGKETLIEAKSLDADRFEIASRQCMNASQFTITALTFEDSVLDPEFPPVEDEIVNNGDGDTNNDADQRFVGLLPEIMRVQLMTPQHFIQKVEERDQIIDFVPIEIIKDCIAVKSKEPKAEPILIQTTKQCRAMTPFTNYIYTNLNLPPPQSSQIAARHSRALMVSGCFEEIKIGVIYVSKNQFSQKEILGNVHKDTSIAFHRFLEALGKVVDMERHGGYTGKLTPSTSPFSVFYSDALHDVMFHVSTLMKTSDTDNQQLLKKRHIGNDNVHIVWCENPQGYDTDTIASQFNDAHIVILPRDNNFFRVLVHRKKKQQIIGPLPEDSIVDADALAPLVRATAIYADRVTRAEMEATPPRRFADLMQPLCAE